MSHSRPLRLSNEDRRRGPAHPSLRLDPARRPILLTEAGQHLRDRPVHGLHEYLREPAGGHAGPGLADPDAAVPRALLQLPGQLHQGLVPPRARHERRYHCRQLAQRVLLSQRERGADPVVVRRPGRPVPVRDDSPARGALPGARRPPGHSEIRAQGHQLGRLPEGRLGAQRCLQADAQRSSQRLRRRSGPSRGPHGRGSRVQEQLEKGTDADQAAVGWDAGFEPDSFEAGAAEVGEKRCVGGRVREEAQPDQSEAAEPPGHQQQTSGQDSR